MLVGTWGSVGMVALGIPRVFGAAGVVLSVVVDGSRVGSVVFLSDADVDEGYGKG